ncbi:MAG: RnfABCDGE type electron transport complex subunit D [Pseudomonadota bacterium]
MAIIEATSSQPSAAAARPQSAPRWRGVARPRLADPRIGQIIALSALASAGVFALGFDVHPAHALIAFGAALGVQAAASLALRLRFDPLSPAITALSLSILFRAEAVWLVALAAAIAIGSKFVLRWNGRHLFNPAALALVATPLLAAPLFDLGAWVSPGQWGALGLWAVIVAGIGATVAGRAARLDTTLTFLAVWAALIFGRAAWVGDPIAIPLWQLQSGAILVFAFHMISDPATTPLRRDMRLLHAALVAALGFALQRAWITDIGPILALVLLAPLVPALDWITRRRIGASDPQTGA